MKKFETGSIYVTDGVNEKLLEDAEFSFFVSHSLERHQIGDWGDLDEEDKEMNNRALRHSDDRLFSKYCFDTNTSIYIITEWDRSCTTILFPDEY